MPENPPHVGWHNFTGVIPTARGTGVARALKVHTVNWARANGRWLLMTGNHEDNAPMRHINESLGYRTLYGELTLRGGLRAEDVRP